MTLSLRDAIMMRVNGKNESELREVIEDSIGGEEMVLPGLGVLFEKIWQSGDADLKNKLVHSLETSLTAKSS
ncbi:small acid-soluble spore protein SspI [Gorillibacterium massiliense]|uniref:small acid-soluble spore protein SspI n=1 Tax=Gorillibacterium massiliense TaxID=1280390 RepID=UPI0004B237B8|nr:small acid-soluble spore protein SspI [Gorillibacterium massiliense]